MKSKLTALSFAGIALLSSVASAYGSHFKITDSDTYTCTLSDGYRSYKAEFTRTISEKITEPSLHIFSQHITFDESVFKSLERVNGRSGCAHSENSGVEYGDVTNPYLGGTALDGLVSFSRSADDQWQNCDYNAHYTVTVLGYASQPTVKYDYELFGKKTLSMTGSCEKQ